MSITLKLTQAALDVLFPEGTEMRVALQQATLQRAATDYVKDGLTDVILAQLNIMVKQVTSTINLEELCIRALQNAPSSKAVLNTVVGSRVYSALSDMVEQRVYSSLNSQMVKLVDAYIADRETRLKKQVEDYIASQITYQEKVLIEARVKAAVKEVIDNLGATLAPSPPVAPVAPSVRVIPEDVPSTEK